MFYPQANTVGAGQFEHEQSCGTDAHSNVCILCIFTLMCACICAHKHTSSVQSLHRFHSCRNQLCIHLCQMWKLHVLDLALGLLRKGICFQDNPSEYRGLDSHVVFGCHAKKSGPLQSNVPHSRN